jgi:circadian clock protein KaiB
MKNDVADEVAKSVDNEALTVVRLYIAGSTPNSQRAQVNLQAVIKKEFASLSKLRIEIVDVFAEPNRAVSDSVIVTPTLVAFGPKSRGVMIGDLSETDKLRSLLKMASAVE